MTNAEWQCTSCGATNRRLVTPSERRVRDRCVTCKTWHEVEQGPRPTFWNATAEP